MIGQEEHAMPTRNFQRLPLIICVLCLAALLHPAAAFADESAMSVHESSAIRLAPFDKLDAADPFAQGHWTLQLYGSGTYSQSNDRLYGGHVGVGYHFLDGVSVNAELGGEFVHSQDSSGTLGGTGGNTGAVELDVIFRWHILRGDNWSLFVDGGAGIMESGESFPAQGTHFNFRPQVGLGATLRLTNDLYLIGGAKLLHISNAGLGGEGHNPGVDSLMYYLGVLIPF